MTNYNMNFESKTKKAFADIERYQYAGLAARLSQSQEGQQYLPGALEELAEDMGINNEGMGFVHAAMSNEQSLEMLIGIYGQKYQAAVGKLTIAEFYKNYQGILEKDLSDDQKKILSEKYSGKDITVSDLLSKVAKIQHQAKSPDKKEQEAAKKEMEKYKDIIGIWQVIENIQYKNLIPKAIERTNKATLENLAQAA